MFQQVLVVLDREASQQAVQIALMFTQATVSELFLLQIEPVKDALPLLLLSKFNRQKEWSQVEPMLCNSLVDGEPVTTLIRPKSKLKVQGIDSAVLNQLEGNFGQVTPFVSHTRSLEAAIADVARLCKADLILVGLSPSHQLAHATLAQAANRPVLTFAPSTLVAREFA